MLPTCTQLLQTGFCSSEFRMPEVRGRLRREGDNFPRLARTFHATPGALRASECCDVEVCLDSSPAECAGVGSGFCWRPKPIHCCKGPANSPIGSEERGPRDDGSEQERLRGRCDREEQRSNAYAGCASRSGTSASAWRNGFPIRRNNSERGPCEGQARASGFSRASRASVV